mmetsp:Transcript_20680/g.49151  ORF Transcript_20680/g.49151 Transcript_20680/m.49151 type:complete len:135 (-) Transcript_20680:22-426(-)
MSLAWKCHRTFSLVLSLLLSTSPPSRSLSPLSSLSSLSPSSLSPSLPSLISALTHSLSSLSLPPLFLSSHHPTVHVRPTEGGGGVGREVGHHLLRRESMGRRKRQPTHNKEHRGPAWEVALTSCEICPEGCALR